MCFGPRSSPRHLYGRFRRRSRWASSFKVWGRFISLSLLSLFPKLFLEVNPASWPDNSAQCNRDAYGGASIKVTRNQCHYRRSMQPLHFRTMQRRVFLVLYHRSFNFSSEFWWTRRSISFFTIDFLTILVKVTCSIESTNNDQQLFIGELNKSTKLKRIRLQSNQNQSFILYSIYKPIIDWIKFYSVFEGSLTVLWFVPLWNHQEFYL